jgi:hypothetical protein
VERVWVLSPPAGGPVDEVAPDIVENVELKFELIVDDVVKAGREEIETEAWAKALSSELAL